MLVKRMAPQKALVAIARKLLVIIWNVLTQGIVKLTTPFYK
jgi:hypothetical protein